MAELFEIRNEDDLFRAIDLARDGEWPADLLPRFVDWPRYEITIRGEDFDGGVPTRIMPALLLLQRTINKAYSRSVYGVALRRLSDEDLRRTELIVRLEPGSTKFWSDLAPGLNAALANMTGRQAVITILGVAAIGAGTYMWAAYINEETERRNIEHRVEMSELETRRLGIVAALVEGDEAIASYLDDTHRTQGEFMKRLQDDDRLVIGGEEIVNGEIARQIARPQHPERVEDRLDSTFIILSVDSGKIRDGYRVQVRDLRTRQELPVLIPRGTLPAEQIRALQSGEWEKVPLRMNINIERRGSRILRATLISAGLARADEIEDQ